ncbi:MAG: chromosomal replication initiator protein DnaA [Oscillospiraceae bacterium]|nr:chromosomal replication initiator protein DnaA [Oscillospiraceae bacterium]MCI6359207.1 chromosomal replication initiator protein DnaA [Clostridiales bacterium]MDD6936677.1 chromosomal replication initiator protein DnaA [Clostridiales bacterium]MDY2961422.1 chromosomal replication initiator protein DnaA [Oscillospiraceae bacterium]MDY5594385.1 chromosomal replication initiator protein DnaA [Oscillospiraceae bacterium]
MNSLNDIWASVMEILSGELTQTAVNTWFSDCTPVEIGDNTLVLHTSSDFKRSIIKSRFEETICAALYELFSCPFELVVLAGEDELQEYREKKPSSEDMPEMDGYTFDRFVVGPSNKFAHAAAIAVAQNPGKIYNPLFIYGNSGLGKTHLLLSIGQAIRQSTPAANIAYVKAEDFVNQMIRSIQSGATEAFRQKYRNADLLLMDDIQFIAGKESTQEEFFHTFNCLYEAGKQIVITSDRPPLEMVKLDDRLRTRFEGGLLADVQPPDVETRMAIIRNKAAQFGMMLSDDVVKYIAENITSNVRQLEGVVKRLTAYRDILDDTITVDSVKRAIKDVIRTGAYIPTPEVIIEETARYYQLTGDDLRGQRRSKNTAMARQVSMYLMRNLTNLSLQDIGSEYGDRNHSTVLSSIRKVEDLLKSNPDMAGTVRDITSNINSKN